MELLTSLTRSESVETSILKHLIGLSKIFFDTRKNGDPNVSSEFFGHMTTWIFQNKTLTENRTDPQFNCLGFSWMNCLSIAVVSILCGIIFNVSSPTGLNLVPKFRSGEKVTLVTPQIVLEKYWDEAIIVDARPNTYYEKRHIKKAVNVPLELFNTFYMMELNGLDRNKPIIVYGRTISRHYDVEVSQKLVLRGHNNTMIIKGSLSAWMKKGYPIES